MATHGGNCLTSLDDIMFGLTCGRVHIVDGFMQYGSLYRRRLQSGFTIQKRAEKSSNYACTNSASDREWDWMEKSLTARHQNMPRCQPLPPLQWPSRPIPSLAVRIQMELQETARKLSNTTNYSSPSHPLSAVQETESKKKNRRHRFSVAGQIQNRDKKRNKKFKKKCCKT